MNKLFEANWAAVKEALLNEEPCVAVGRETVPWLEENTRRKLMEATIYTKDNCPYCVRAKHLLSTKGISYHEVNATENRESLIQKVTEATGAAPRTVPQIWLGGSYIGGFTELEAYFKNQA